MYSAGSPALPSRLPQGWDSASTWATPTSTSSEQPRSAFTSASAGSSTLAGPAHGPSRNNFHLSKSPSPIHGVHHARYNTQSEPHASPAELGRPSTHRQSVAAAEWRSHEAST